MSAISSPTYDPKSTATSLATDYIAPTKAILDDQDATATAVSNGLTTLSSAMTAFQTAMSSLASSTSTVSAAAATFSNPSVASATAKSTAVAGTYSFYVEQLATAGQVAYGGITDTTAAGSGQLNVVLANGTNFQVDLANADTNHDGILSAKEIAAAINTAANNNSSVTASTLTVGGTSTLVLTSNQTGAANSVSLDTSGVTNAALKSQLDDPTQKKQLVAAQDAVLWVGPQGTGSKITQASNVFNIVDDVSITITKAQLAGDSPVTMTVGQDTSTTGKNVQAFVDAWNTLNKALDGLTAPGNPTSTPVVMPGAFANDAGLAALRQRMQAALRTVTNGQSLITYGISAQRDGSLDLDTTRLNKTLAANPGAIDNIFGKAIPGNEAGVLGTLDTLMNQWTAAGTGQISTRSATVSKQQDDIINRRATLQTQYDNAYNRYLTQFTALQQLQSEMNGNSNLFTALFSSNSSSS
jgi:flagellar hook-associated protein 2